MAIAISRDDDQRRFTAVGSEMVTSDDILTLISTCRVGRYRSYALVFDIRAATICVTPAAMLEFAARADALQEQEGPPGPAAIVADRPGVLALARLYERLVQRASRPPLRIVADPAEAHRWLTTFD